MGLTALEAALRDLVLATSSPIDKAAQQRWRAHKDACRSEGLCELTGEPLYHCYGHGHYHGPDGEAYLQPEPMFLHG